MCGIAGIVRIDRTDDLAAIKRMAQSLAHRGPDHVGIHIESGVALAHRRLAVIDLQDAANQPMCDVSRRYWIVFNGEIYNYLSLRRDLKREGFTFRTSSDTEVLLYSFIKWKEACLDRLNGMFAFAIWDSTERKLFLARDRLGKKPLFYARTSAGFIFASELKALLQHGAVPREVNAAAISYFLSLNYLPNHECIIKGVVKLPPAHYLEINAEVDRAPVRYWDLAEFFRQKNNDIGVTQATEELDALIDDAVRMRLVADVPVGAFLSGGVDSSIVAATMVQARRSAAVRTFSIGFEQPSYSELPQARAVSALLGVEHQDRLVGAQVSKDIEKIVYFADEPFADSSIIPTYYLSAFAREAVTVSLSGDGGDELFAGYETYVADKVRNYATYLPNSLLRLFRTAVDVMPTSFDKVSIDYKLRRFLSGMRLDAEKAHCYWRYIFDDNEKDRILSNEARIATEGVDVFSYFKRYFDELSNASFLDRASYVDIKTWLADDILVKVDRASMAHALEVRCPLLDRRIVEFAARLPPHLKLKGFDKKFLLKRVGKRVLPRRVFQGPKKGFNAPVSYWLMRELKEIARDVMAGKVLAKWVDRGAMDLLWQEHEAGKRDHGLKLFGLLSLGIWLERLQRDSIA